MHCELCDKQATVHLTEIVNGKKVERHLCERCACEEGVTVKNQVPISQILNNLNQSYKDSQKVTEIHCPQCNTTWNDFRSSGLMGCPNDYVVFENLLHKIIEKSHEGALYHVGRIPQVKSGHPAESPLEIMRLRKELQSAIEAEDYERAAQLRDEIEQLGRPY